MKKIILCCFVFCSFISSSLFGKDFHISISAVGVNKGIEEPEAIIKVEEFLSTNMKPLLNYVFFDHNSSTLPDRYKGIDSATRANFDENDFFNTGTLDTYYHVLNIIGFRLTQDKNAKIVIRGCNSNYEEEEGNIKLSRGRALTVKNYFTEKWAISNDRIKIKCRNLPDKYSNKKTAEGIEENRRAEITSDSKNILAPLILHDTLRTANPPTIRFYPKLDIEGDNSYVWKLTIMQGKTLKEFSGKNDLPPSIDWFINDEKNTIPAAVGAIVYKLETTADDGRNSSYTDSIALKRITIQNKKLNKIDDKIIDNYSLILFDYDSPMLESTNMSIANFVRGRLKANSEVEITGYTDGTGDANHNMKLSESRAKSASKAIRHKNAKYKGLGESVLLYDNKLPEGRYYCRTVFIHVETKIEY